MEDNDFLRKKQGLRNFIFTYLRLYKNFRFLGMLLII